MMYFSLFVLFLMFSLFIQFITEIPRKRNLKKGSPLGRRALYRDFSIVQVESEKSSDDRAWKKVRSF